MLPELSPGARRFFTRLRDFANSTPAGDFLIVGETARKVRRIVAIFWPPSITIDNFG
jgi:hypothetical protein